MAPKDGVASASKTKGDGQKRERKLKDPHAPPKPQSAYMLWSQANRKEVKDKFPDLTFGQLGKKLGELWQALNPADKQVWQTKAETAKAEYERLNDEYMKTPQYHAFQTQKKEAKAAKAPKAPKAPKTPKTPKGKVTAFEVFKEQVGIQNPTATPADIDKFATENWEKMTPADKEPYDSMAKTQSKAKASASKKAAPAAAAATAAAAPSAAPAAEDEGEDDDGGDDDEDEDDEDED